MAYFFFVATDNASDEGKATAPEIAATLLKEGFWAFARQVTAATRLQPGDQVLIYLGGKGRHHFVASARVAAPMQQATDDERRVLTDLGLPFMDCVIRLSGIEWFPEPVKIVPLINELSFISNKQHWGLSFRYPIRKLPEDDLKLLLGRN